MRKRSAVPVVAPLLVPLLALGLVASLGAGKKAKNGGGEKPEQQQTTDQPPPAPVVATVQDRLPGSTITGYEHETDDKRQLFFVDVTTSAGKNVTLLISGRGQYLGQVIDNEEDDGDVFIDAATAPDGVKKGINKYYKVDDVSKAELDNLFMEVEESRFIFVTERTKKNITEWVSLAINGNIVSVETETDLKDVPSAVKDAVTKAHPNGKVTGAAFTDEREKKTTYYTIEVTDGTKLEVTVSPEGKIQATEPVEDDTTKPG